MIDQPPIVFGDFRSFIAIVLAPSSALDEQQIDKAARDLEIIIASNGSMFYRHHPVESFCGVPARDVAPQILLRRHALGVEG